MLNKTTIFSIAHTDLTFHPMGNQLRTLRVFFPCNSKSKAIRVVLSNKYGKDSLKIGRITLAFCDEKGNINEITDIMTLKVNGENEFEIEKGEDVTTDRMTLMTRPNQYIAINIYYPESHKPISGNLLGDYAIRSVREGNFTDDTEFYSPGIIKKISHALLPNDAATPLTTIKEVYVETEEEHNVVAVLGDSLTQQGTWVNPLIKRLYKKYPGKISICNLGIGGNRIVYDSPKLMRGLYGEAGIIRFLHSVLTLKGLTHVVIALGTNDIGLPGKDNIPLEELISLKDYIKAQSYIINVIKDKNPAIKVYGVTLIPRRIMPPFDGEREALRREMNQWIRTTNLFDGVIDFDKYAFIDAEQATLRQGLYIIDGLHLSEEGGRELSDMIDEDLFL